MGKVLAYGEITVANMTEPFTVMLTNEAQQFATDSNRKVTSAQSYYTDIIVIRGSQERTDYTIGNITSGSGITVSKNSKRVTFSVSAGTTIGADAGVIEIPITLDGQTVKKQFSWSCGKQGPQGVKGENGSNFAWNLVKGTGTPKEFKPKANLDNSSTVFYMLDLSDNLPSLGDKFTISCDIEWTQFTQGTGGTFSWWFQGSVDGGWIYDNLFTTALRGVQPSKDTLLSSSGSKHLSASCTIGAALVGKKVFEIGARFNYSDGTGMIKVSNLKIAKEDKESPWCLHPDELKGDKGKSVQSVIEYYLATSASSNVTSSTNGWSTDPATQKLTAEKKYLWNCKQTVYDDGTRGSITSPVICGTYGETGKNALQSNRTYTGTYTTVGETAYTSTSSFNRTPIVGDIYTCLDGSSNTGTWQVTAISGTSVTVKLLGYVKSKGEDGKNGADGAGFHWNLLKYSGDLSKQVLGGAGTYTATVESIEDKTTPSGQAEKITYTVQGTGGKFIQTGKYIKEGNIKQGKTYTVSVWCKCSSIKSTGVINAEFLDNKTYVNPTLSTEWQQYVVTGVANKDVTSTSSASAISFYYSDNMSVGDIFYISSPKVEEGDKASPWCTTYEETLAKNLTITPSSQYFKSTDGGKTFAPNAITIKATIQGEINFGKWQYSIDGGVSFADAVSGQKGLTISNNVLTVSKDSSLYSDAVTMVTFRAVASDSGFYDTCSIAKIYDVSELEIGGVNLFVKSTVSRGYWLSDTGVLNANGGWGYSDYIDVSGMKNYIASGFTNLGISPSTCFYDSNKTFISGVQSTNQNSQDSKRKTLPIPSNAKYMRFSFALADIDTLKIEQGTKATAYSPSPKDLQTAILSTKSEISDVSLKVDKNKQAIEQRVEKTTYQQDLNLVKGDISKANEGLNKWRYEIYPKSLFASEYQGKSTMDVFAKNTNLTPSQSMLINDTDLSIAWNYDNNYIGYALTFAKFSTAKSVAITFAHDNGAHIYLNGKLIGGSDAYSKTGESLTLGFVKGWNCIEVVVNEGASTEGFKLGTTLSAISECQLMNCYYGTPVARQSHITNQLVQNTTDIKGISTKVSKVTSVIGEDGKNFTDFKNDYSDFKQTMNGFKTTVGQTYVTKDDFDDLQIGGRNLLLYSANLKNGYYTNIYDTADETFKGCSVFKVNHAWNGIRPYFNKHITERNVIKAGDVLTYSVYAKTDDTKEIDIMMFNRTMDSDSGQGAIRGNQGELKLSNDWKLYSVTFKVTESMLSVDKGLSWFGYELCNNTSSGKYVYFACPKLENSNKPTDWTPAPEDVNGKIVNVETIANQTAKKFEWIVKGGDSSSNFTLTDRVADLVAERINFKGLVTFSGLNTDAKNEIGKVAQSKVDGLEIGGRNLIINSNLSRTLTNVTNDGCSNMTVVSDSVYGHALKFTAVNQRRVFWATSNVWVKNKTYTVSFVAKSSVTGQKIRPSRSTADWGDDITLTTSYARYTTKITSLDTNAGGTLSFSCTNAVGDITITNVKLEVGNKATDWTPAPEDVSQDATNKASQALTDAKNYSSNAVNWVTNNGSSTTSLNSMVKKWTDGAVSDTAQINGGWIKANTITASKIALADFTNYSQLTRDTADAYGFTVTDDTDGTWFSTKNIKRDQFISEIFPCNGGESYLIEYDISTNAKGANNSTDTKNYIGVAIGVYGYTGTVGSNGLPNKATNIWYADRITGSETAPSIHVKTTITTSTATKQFRVFLQSNGYYFEGTTKIRNLSVRRMYGGTLIVDGSITADKIATDAIKSRNYISSGGTQGSFLNLSDGSFQSPNLSWDSNGNLIAKNANLSGEITATNGSIAGWTIISNKMYTTGSGKYTGIGKYGSAYAFWAGATSNDNGNSAVFKVSHTGKLTATDADITGTITATNGKIGRYDITSTYLMTNSGSNASGIGGNQAFWAGAEDSNSAPFRVGYDGVLWAENAAIRGSIETGNLGDEGDTVSIINGHIGIQGPSNNVEIYSTGFKFGIDGDYYLMSVSEGVKCYRNLYATDFVADGWLYCSEVHSSGAVVIGADSESFYWAHGYQIARGTSWGGVCVGDDSQQLRLYGSSIWASHSISTSDENLKENFTTLDQYENFYMNLNPIGFNYIGDYDGKKTHFGFGAHKTEDVLESEGYDADKFAVVTHRPLVQEDIEKRFGKDVEVDIETEYGVSYTEFIALNTHMIQKTRRELTKVKQEKADLEVRLQAIEAKLGL